MYFELKHFVQVRQVFDFPRSDFRINHFNTFGAFAIWPLQWTKHSHKLVSENWSISHQLVDTYNGDKDIDDT